MSATKLKMIERTLQLAGSMYDGGSADDRAAIASEWAESFSAEGVESWVEAECWDASTAVLLSRAGFEPGVHTLRYRDGSDAAAAMYDLCNNDIALSDLDFGGAA